ncbi:Pmt5p [Rhizophagus irregularis DAOM 197198w]|uniref:Pmt5p n=1 Tax=Rhizophagus irregularis (strain DAOM 197198w) TaxID=1432141 RepID=A0A015JUY4_RHIIW|nr:Pmt5p [Rhizophagus irregularis DAOM 197198w]
MDLPKYTGTIHPEEWVKQVQIYCYLKGIESEGKIIKFSKLMIDYTIIIPNVNEINSFEELIKALKLHSTFSIYKNSCKRKLQLIKYIPEQEDVATFLANFRSLCMEISDHKEIITMLINSYSNYFFKGEFIKRVEGINSVDEIFKIFSEVVFDELKIIKFGSSIALKHVATGKYLSSWNVNYPTGSKQRVVFAGEKLSNGNALWYATCTTTNRNYQNCTYDDRFYLTHKVTGKKLCMSINYKSPTTRHAEVSCRNEGDSLNWININPTNGYATYVKARDVITLKYNDYIFVVMISHLQLEIKLFKKLLPMKKELVEMMSGKLKFFIAIKFTLSIGLKKFMNSKVNMDERSFL